MIFARSHSLKLLTYSLIRISFLKMPSHVPNFLTLKKTNPNNATP